MYNPFMERQDGDHKDQDLIDSALNGGDAELEKLILRHQAWIYNIALGMTLDSFKAEDITQEILIKMVTSLSTYDKSKAAFRTWLYRIVVNHVLSERRGKKEEVFLSLVTADVYKNVLESIPDKKANRSPEKELLIKEARNTCVSGMLLCLDKRQRLVFILGAIFGVNDTAGSEILDISQDNYRKILSRSRRKLSNFFANTCSLINEKNPCKCSRWVAPMEKLNLIGQGRVGKPMPVRSIAEVVQDHAGECCDLYDQKMIRLYRSLPFTEPPDMVLWLRKLMATDSFKLFMDLN